MGQVVSPSVSPTCPQNKTIPTWGSNLVQIHEIQDEDTLENCKVAANVENTKLYENFKEVERFVEEFQTGVMNTQSRVNKSTAPLVDFAEYNQESVVVEDGDNSENSSINSETRSKEIQMDSNVVDYFKQLEEYKAKQKKRREAIDGKTAASPAKAGIPVTTPKSTPVPKRRVKFSDASKSEAAKENVMVGFNEAMVDSSTEESEDEYREYERRLKHVQRVLEQNLTRLRLQKKSGAKSP